MGQSNIPRWREAFRSGFTLLRFSDEEVLNNIQSVFNYLEDWIEKKLAGSSDPPPLEISL